jgi:hypothetical protein
LKAEQAKQTWAGWGDFERRQKSRADMGLRLWILREETKQLDKHSSELVAIETRKSQTIVQPDSILRAGQAKQTWERTRLLWEETEKPRRHKVGLYGILEKREKQPNKTWLSRDGNWDNREARPINWFSLYFESRESQADIRASRVAFKRKQKSRTDKRRPMSGFEGREKQPNRTWATIDFVWDRKEAGPFIDLLVILEGRTDQPDILAGWIYFERRQRSHVDIHLPCQGFERRERQSDKTWVTIEYFWDRKEARAW